MDGVIITGMKMPESCVMCNSINCSKPFKKNSHNEVIKQQYLSKIHEDCHLKSVKGLIDRIWDEYPDHQCTGELTGYAEAIVDVVGIIKEYCNVSDIKEK